MDNLPKIGSRVLVKACALPDKRQAGMARVRRPGGGGRRHFFEHEATPIVVTPEHLKMMISGNIEITDGANLPQPNPALLARMKREASRDPVKDLQAAISGQLVPKVIPAPESVTTPLDAPPSLSAETDGYFADDPDEG